MTEEFENKDDKGSRRQISTAEGTDHLDGAWRTRASEGKEGGQTGQQTQENKQQDGAHGEYFVNIRSVQNSVKRQKRTAFRNYRKN